MVQTVKLIPSLLAWKTETKDVVPRACCGPNTTLISKLNKKFFFKGVERTKRQYAMDAKICNQYGQIKLSSDGAMDSEFE